MYTWEYRKPYEWMESNPHIALTPEEHVVEANPCYDAGAAILHIHARDPRDPANVSNAQSGERVVLLAREVGRPIAFAARAREMLGISAQPSQYGGVAR